MIGIARLTRRGLTAVLLVIGIDFAATPVHAQLAPSQPIKIVVGVPAGGLGDLAARILAQRLSENGHPAIVENRLGGNGIIATDAVAKSRADGYTLIMANQRWTVGHDWTHSDKNPCAVPIPSAYLA
jgi:tripartite-type tricarboxylate transporter receptor subunit TctC